MIDLLKKMFDSEGVIKECHCKMVELFKDKLNENGIIVKDRSFFKPLAMSMYGLLTKISSSHVYKSVLEISDISVLVKVEMECVISMLKDKEINEVCDAGVFISKRADMFEFECWVITGDKV